MGDTDLDFIRKDKLYVADFSSWIRDDYEECADAMLALMTATLTLHKKGTEGSTMGKGVCQ